jgi:hypothetical protein
MNCGIIYIPKLNMTKEQKHKWLLKTFGSGVLNSGFILFIEK